MNSSLVPAQLTSFMPDARDAKLPAVYESAKQALTACARIDECKGWADKAIALASYARQAKDETLLKMAIRIQTRAITRAGELIEEVEPQQGGDRKSKGRERPLDRKQAARDAGLSERQQKAAQRAARFKADNPEEFEARVDSESPPTPNQLARLGNHRNPSRTSEQFQAATKYLGAIGRLKEFLGQSSPGEIVAGLASESELRRALKATSLVTAKLDSLQEALEWELNSEKSTTKSRPRMKK